jgi:hypothetical protein
MRVVACAHVGSIHEVPRMFANICSLAENQALLKLFSSTVCRR